MILENLPDEELMQKLEYKRGKGRDDYPIRAMWNSVIAGNIQARRRFTPIARSSYKWENIYKFSTSVERVNSRIDNVYGFEKHYIRGIKKMKMRCSLALIVMLVKEIAILREGVKRRQKQVA